jgi:hypothetical protein
MHSGTCWRLLHIMLLNAYIILLNACIILLNVCYSVSQPGETNSVDQRLLELELWEQAKVKVCSIN